MKFVFFVYVTIILVNLVGLNESKEPEFQNSGICKSNTCSDINSGDEVNSFETTIASQAETEELSDDFLKKNFYENDSERDNLNPSDIFKSFNVSENYNDNNKRQTKNKASGEVKKFVINVNETTDFENGSGLSDSAEYETEAFNSIDVTNTTFYPISEEDVLNTTIILDVSEKSVKSKTKSSSSTTQLLSTTHSPLSSDVHYFQNFGKGRNICLCDLTVNQCDINCCCDKDCSLVHWKVFTKCNDVDVEYDSKYCYKTNFIFENNTQHKIIQNKGGLFCIVRDNSHLSSNYKNRQIILTLESFSKNVPSNYYSFSHKRQMRPDFEANDYKAGFNVWIIQNGEVKPFEIPAPTVGLLCTSQVKIKYLVDQFTVCSHQHPQNEIECRNSKTKNIFNYLRDIKIIASPGFVNKSHKSDVEKICQGKTCIRINSYICKSSMNFPYCIKLTEKASNFPKIGCWNTVSKINYQIWHNGSDGIKKFEAYIWLGNTSRNLKEHLLQTTGVKYSWVGPSKKIFERSGNPGYLTGKPLLTGRKVYYASNGSEAKKEAIEMSLDTKDWLSVLGSDKGICSFKKRIPIKFRENGQYTCSLKLTKDNFGKNKCLELQHSIFKFLIGSDITNATNDNYLNKFVATFGNSKVEETGDWVQVLIDLSPVISSQIAFKSNYNNLMCRNIITDLFVDIAYSNIGSFLNPQPKILGVSFHFGKHKDLIFYCDTLGCENTTPVQFFKLSSMVHFFDITEPAIDEFAEPLGLEAKLPHDFFYPFFSKSSISQCLNTHVFILFLLTFL